MRTNGQASDPVNGHRFVTFGDDCPCCTDGIAVHEARIAMIDEGGDIVLPQFYALCCACERAQFITKYGFDFLQPCGCDDVPLAEIARAARDTTVRRAAEVEAGIEAWREDLRQQLAAGSAGELTELASAGGTVVKIRE